MLSNTLDFLRLFLSYTNGLFCLCQGQYLRILLNSIIGNGISYVKALQKSLSSNLDLLRLVGIY
jgi:hypothetical protein